MKLINADYLTGRIFTEASLKNAHTCYLTIMAIIKSMESEDVLNKIRAEIDEIPLSEPMVSRDGLYCYGSKSITIGHFREKVLEIIDKYRNEVSE